MPHYIHTPKSEIMERLEFGSESRYVAIEAAIHTARYLTVKALCAGRNVLDVACGEGYGSWLMSRWGAQSVLGVDVAADAVANANSRFSSPTVRFVTGTGESLGQAVGDARFDLIVSLETIEHVDDPELFLRNIKAVARPDATIVISAPNDYWYYDQGGRNEFHKRKFTLQEFQDLTERVLGKAQSWSLGTLGIGFAISSQDSDLQSGNSASPQDLMLDYRHIDAAVYVPSQVESDATSAEAAFYVGVWGDASIAKTVFAGYPVSMNLGRQPLFPRDEVWAIKPDPTVTLQRDSLAIRLNEKCEKLEAQNLSAEAALAEMTTLASDRQVQCEKLEAQNLSAQAALVQMTTLASDRQVQCEKLEAQNLSAQAALVQMTTLANDRQVQCEALLSEVRDLQNREHQLIALHESAVERLHFSQKDVERMGMSARAARAEVETAWRAFSRHEAATRELQSALEKEANDSDDLRRQLELSFRTATVANERLASADAHLARVPWRVVKVWWIVRRAVPTPVLRLTGRLLHSFR